MAAIVGKTIDALLTQRHMLRHPFYEAWNAGQLTHDALQQYAAQYYHFVKDFPRMVSAVHTNTPDLSIRQELLQNLIDEEQGSENHPSLWMRFAESLGMSSEAVNNTAPLPSTTALVETMMNNCREMMFQEGIATLYAYEAQIPEVARVKIEGLKTFYGISDPDAIKFFTVHQEADVYHSAAERNLLDRHTQPQDSQRVCAAAERTANALWGFLDGVQEAFT